MACHPCRLRRMSRHLDKVHALLDDQQLPYQAPRHRQAQARAPTRTVPPGCGSALVLAPAPAPRLHRSPPRQDIDRAAGLAAASSCSDDQCCGSAPQNEAAAGSGCRSQAEPPAAAAAARKPPYISAGCIPYMCEVMAVPARQAEPLSPATTTRHAASAASNANSARRVLHGCMHLLH